VFADLEHGKRYRLPQFISENKENLDAEYENLSAAEKKAFVKSIMTARESQKKMARANPKALQQDVNMTFKGMETEVRYNSLPINIILHLLHYSGLRSARELGLKVSTLLLGEASKITMNQRSSCPIKQSNSCRASLKRSRKHLRSSWNPG
jgi:hypothetical protein